MYTLDREFLPARQDCIHRQRLDAQIRRGLDDPLITVIAGPGYGKTQAVASFARRFSGRLVWLSLRWRDDDPRYFFEKLLTQTKRELPALAEELSRVGMPRTAGGLNAFLRVLAAYSGDKMDKVDKMDKILFVADGCENITHIKILALYRAVVEAEYKNICILLISTRPLYVATGLVPESHLQITARDLAFTPAETGAFLRARHMPAAKDDIKQALDQTGGWPFALHLLYLQYRDKKTIDPADFFLVAADLFETRYYVNYPRYMQHLLIQLSLLPGFSVEMVQQFAGQHADSVLEFLYAHPFLFYDFSTGHFSFQKLYGQFLRSKAGLLEKQTVLAAKTHSDALRSVALTGREQKTLEHMFQGLTRREIAQALGVSLGSVKKYIANIYTKLGAVNRADAIHIAIAKGLLRPNL